jgi:hypothetical protein
MQQFSKVRRLHMRYPEATEGLIARMVFDCARAQPDAVRLPSLPGDVLAVPVAVTQPTCFAYTLAINSYSCMPRIE